MKKVKRTFIQLPVKDLEKSRNFFTQLGFFFDTQLTDDRSASLIIIEDCVYCMLVREDFFDAFTSKPVALNAQTTEVVIAIEVDNKEAVDDMIREVVAGGGAIYSEPADRGWLYQHFFYDPDGHQWEVYAVDKGRMVSR
ncbi:MAG: VOC family protein [Bacteroidales bacterium]